MNKLKQLIQYFLESPRPIKRLITLSFDLFSIPLCIAFSVWAEFGNGFIWKQVDFIVTFLTLIFSVVVFVRLGFYRAILRYIGVTTISVILVGITLSSLVFSGLYWSFHNYISLSLTMFYWCYLTLVVGGSRLVFKTYIEQSNRSVSNVGIYGAGAAGRQLASALKQGNQYQPMAFFDDDNSLLGSEIDGLGVFEPDKIEFVINKYKLTHIFLAMPSTSHSRRGDILTNLEPYPVKIKTIAGMEDIVTGKTGIQDLQDIEVEDLLGRDPVIPNKQMLERNITGKVVMVTGAGGSIGSELCRQIIINRPSKLVLFELSEFALYRIEKELSVFIKSAELDVSIIPLMGSVQHKNRISQVMTYFRVQTVYHAAAYKHVPIVEHNVVEGIRNNVYGTWNAAEAAIEAGVEKFVLISTDKAVRPTNIMGASKRVAELVLQAMSERDSRTTFTMVRFGNVLGSSGSVVPLFREQINKDGPVTVTHPDIIRYFMTIPEAAQLVIQAGAMGTGGDVFVLDMGEPVKIAALAEKMIHLMGRTIKSKENPKGDIEICYSGLRPGEKLYEELLIGENVVGTEHPRIMAAKEEYLPWPEMKKVLSFMDELCNKMDCEGIVQLLLRTPTGYNPQHAVCDLLWTIENRNERLEDKVIKFKTLS